MPERIADRFDVLIGGGGLAGLCLARQLRLHLPQLKIAVIDAHARPLPEAAFKVGESTVEIAAHYLGKILGLEDYLHERQLTKFGLRYFMGEGHLPLDQRDEWGTDQAMPVPSYQLDRGRLEEDLRELLLGTGVQLLEGQKVSDIALAEADEDHVVTVRNATGTEEYRCRWFVDAMGRRKFLQRKLGLEKSSPHRASAVWFRMAGRLDVEDLVAEDRNFWHERVPDKRRFFSTNHFMGKGYWVWLIPLSSGNTSVGIVTEEALHPYRSYASYDKALEWLKKYEPALFRYLQGREPLDFLGLRHFSHLTKKAFSHQRWACVGEAGIFLDPFYSPGSDIIALSNLITESLIRLDLQGTLDATMARNYNQFFLGFVKTFLQTYTGRYVVFGAPQVAAEKILWDTCLYWVWAGQLFFRGLLDKPHLFPRLMQLGIQFSLLHRQMQDFFCQWAEQTQGIQQAPFTAPLNIPIFKKLHLDLVREKTPDQAIADMWTNLAKFEEWAQVLFFRVLTQTDPEATSALGEHPWVDAWSINLDPATWEASGLRNPTSSPRSLDAIRRDLAKATFAERVG